MYLFIYEILTVIKNFVNIIMEFQVSNSYKEMSFERMKLQNKNQSCNKGSDMKHKQQISLKKYFQLQSVEKMGVQSIIANIVAPVNNQPPTSVGIKSYSGPVL